MNKLRLAILGSTGSIGCSTLEVVRQNRDRFEIVALAANANASLLAEQCSRYTPRVVAISDDSHMESLRPMLPSATRLYGGKDAMRCLLQHEEIDAVVVAVSGFAGFEAVVHSIDLGKNIAIANKEALVAGGDILLNLLKTSQSILTPVDSEHASIFQALSAHCPTEYISCNQKAQSATPQITPIEVRSNHLIRSPQSITLTASGGPFYKTPLPELERISIANALAHPRWKMGRKISIDSATMMNKGLEVIEAARLFSLPEQSIKTVIHPESVIHGMVQFPDGVSIAVLYQPSMCVPISYALGDLYRLHFGSSALEDCRFTALRAIDIESGVSHANLEEIGSLSFFNTDNHRFPAVELCREALRRGGPWATVLNAANEVAVDAFLAGNIGFLEIVKIVDKSLNKYQPEAFSTIGDVLHADKIGRQIAEDFVTTSK